MVKGTTVKIFVKTPALLPTLIVRVHSQFKDLWNVLDHFKSSKKLWKKIMIIIKNLKKPFNKYIKYI
jgi:hypothetical protein